MLHNNIRIKIFIVKMCQILYLKVIVEEYIVFSKRLVWFGFNRGHYEVSTGSSVEAMSIPFTRSLL